MSKSETIERLACSVPGCDWDPPEFHGKLLDVSPDKTVAAAIGIFEAFTEHWILKHDANRTAIGQAQLVLKMADGRSIPLRAKNSSEADA